MATEVASRESVGFRFLPGITGIEILDANNSARNWKWFHTAFGLAFMTSWSGDVCYRRRRYTLEPGMALCTTPGEVHTAPRVWTPGGFNVFMIDAGVFQDYVAEHGVPHSRAEWGKIAPKVSPTLATRIAAALRPELLGASPMEAQSSVVALFAAVAQELIEKAVSVRPAQAGERAADRIRECLHSDEGVALDLQRLAEKVGLSRFQVVRVFRARYGLPPHTYQLCSRIARARALLRAGHTPAEVSAFCGFADQSHFGRHFKRLVGATPARYAHAHDSARHSKLRRTMAEAGASSGELAVLSRT